MDNKINVGHKPLQTYPLRLTNSHTQTHTQHTELPTIKHTHTNIVHFYSYKPFMKNFTVKENHIDSAVSESFGTNRRTDKETSCNLRIRQEQNQKKRMNIQTYNCYYLSGWLRNRLILAGLELVFSHTEKSCIASQYRQFSTNNKILKIIRFKQAFGTSGLTKLVSISYFSF